MKPRLAVIALLTLLTGCSKQAAEAPPPEARLEGESIVFPAGSAQLDGIRSKEIALQPVPDIHLNGRLTWNEDRTVRIYTPFSGRVERILVQPGEKVGKGQPLVVIASPEFGQSQADAKRAESDYGLAEKNLARVRELEQHGVAARKDLQAAEADYGRSQSELERARKKLALYGKTGNGIDQTYTLSSPIAGVVVEKTINPGQELRPDQMTANAPPLFVITDPASLWVQLDAAEKDLGLLRPGKTVVVHAPAYRDEKFPAKVTAVSDFLDPATRTIKARALLDNSGRKLKGEMYVTADVSTDGEAELLVPAKAVFFQGEKHLVFIDNGNGKYTRRVVRIGDVRQNMIEILDGLHEGEKVVTEGSLMLQQVLQPRRVQK
jgi:cobalt-zinc-cadmium efflux system membrane fusion protein